MGRDAAFPDIMPDISQPDSMLTCLQCRFFDIDPGDPDTETRFKLICKQNQYTQRSSFSNLAEFCDILFTAERSCEEFKSLEDE